MLHLSDINNLNIKYYEKLALISILCFSIMACSEETEVFPEEESTQEQAEMNRDSSNSALDNFRQAINEMNNPKYFPTKEYTEKYGDELSDERKQILIEPAKDLIYSSGISKEELSKRTNDNRDNILNMAFNIYITQNSKK